MSHEMHIGDDSDGTLSSSPLFGLQIMDTRMRTLLLLSSRCWADRVHVSVQIHRALLSIPLRSRVTLSVLLDLVKINIGS